MTAKVDISLATHAEFQERVAKSRPAVTNMLWRMVLEKMNIVAATARMVSALCGTPIVAMNRWR